MTPQIDNSHPTVCFFHVFFKACSFFLFLLPTLFFEDFVTAVVVIVLFFAADFWTVKNISGRKLVGLRWWNRIDNNMNSEWVFESRNDGRISNPTDDKVFWFATYVTPVLWIVLGVLDFIQFQFTWLTVVAMGLVLSGANMIGYLKCAKDQQKKLQDLAGQFIVSQAAGQVGL
eukprot:TRINITY_DN34892_c0_g1_i1.p1 TRINITY_DN34892_c0_g1~~TRINITY_DN34892_c0_g1_i1.p1  ORF type:complete len:173 (-),score=36.72 TRINITY_DN34892_c0_g1_i1:50-568(-)